MKSKIKFLAALLFIIIATISYAQKFGDFEDSLVRQAIHPTDSSAHAAQIRESVHVRYDFSIPNKMYLIMEYHYITKIYDADGEEYASFSIPIYKSGGKDEKVTDVKAVTYNEVNGSVVESKLSRKDIYEEESSENYNRVKFALPNVKPGSVIEVKYTLQTPYLYSIPKWYFQNYIPTDESKYTIDVPSYFILTPIPSGTIQLERESTKLPISDHDEVRYVFMAKNVEAFKTDKYVLNDNDYRSGLKYEIKRVEFPNQPAKQYSDSWDEIAKRLNQSDYFGRQYNKNIKSAESVIASTRLLPLDQRIEPIYKYVKNNYVWNKKYGVGSYDGLKSFVDEGSGNIGDINLLLYNLLKKCDVPCFPFVMKSRKSGLLNVNFPTLTDLDYVMVYVPIGDSYMLLDASSKLTPMGQLPTRANNLFGIMLKSDGAKVVNLKMQNTYRIETASDYEFDINKNVLTGITNQRRKNYAATKFRIDQLESEDESDTDDEDDNDATDDEDDQENDYADFSIENEYTVSKVENLDDLSKPVITQIEERLLSCSRVIGDQIFIDATLDFGFKKNPFYDEERKYPIFYNSKVLIRHYASITIPEGYEVESLPQTEAVTLPGDAAVFRYSAAEQNGKVALNYQFVMNKTFHDPEEYQYLKEFYKLIVEKGTQKIILRKQ